MNPIESIKGLLTAHVGVSGWQLEVGQLPPEPDRVIMLSEGVGLAPNPRWLLDFPAVQAMIRGATNGYLAARAEAQAVKDILLRVTPFNVADGRVVSITMPTDISFIGNDENHRPLFSLNFRLITEPAPTAETNREPL